MSLHAYVEPEESLRPDATTRVGEPVPLTVRSYGMTDPGRKRPENEDHFLIATLTKALQVRQTSLPRPRVHYGDEQAHLFVVADGMGGHAGGAEASALAIDALEGFVLNALKWFFHLKGSEGDLVLREFQDALRRAEGRLFAEAAERPELRGMGTTLTMAHSLDDTLFVAHIGDSRCYLLRGENLFQLTHDHTLVQDMVRGGHIKPEEAAGHRLRHVISNVLGGYEPGVRVEVHKARLQPNDVLLLCSDGLTEMLADEEIASVLCSQPDPKAACEQLLAGALERGGKDNITVIVARYEPAAV